MADFAQVLSRYADRVHRLGADNHHVASPLGVWLVVALAAMTADGTEEHELDDVLGVDCAAAAAFAARLLESPHALVSCAAAAWNRPFASTERLESWKEALPRAVETGDIPSQSGLDQWAESHTQGLIRKFPITLTPAVVLLLASALATKVSWSVPFDLAPGSSLGETSPWSSELRQVLATPHSPGHQQFLTDSERAGLVAVHIAEARGGLKVASVVADPGVAAGDVLAAAHVIATAESVTPRSVARHSLFDLSLGESDLWTIREESVETLGGGNEERFESFLPAWSVESELNLDDQALGIPTAASALASVLGLPGYQYAARQAAVARYTRVGFEAAAITGFGMALSRPHYARGIRRVATLRFGHPFAVVAVTFDAHPRRQDAPRTPWHGLPVFSAWITEPDDADDKEDEWGAAPPAR